MKSLVCTLEPLIGRANILAQQLQIVCCTEIPVTESYYLQLDNDGLALCANGKNAPGPLRVDFASGALNYRQGKDKTQELLAKAIGISGKVQPRLWDVTAGLGQDAWILASLGCDVYLYERHPIVYTLLQDGLNRIRDTTVDEGSARHNNVERLHLCQGDGIKVLSDKLTRPPDIVYIDPMFPEKRKAAKAKKAMQYFQVLVGQDQDSEQLLEAALAVTKYRVIVKRPLSASTLNNTKPSAQVLGKTVRFDIYAMQSPQRFLEKRKGEERKVEEKSVEKR